MTVRLLAWLILAQLGATGLAVAQNTTPANSADPQGAPVVQWSATGGTGHYYQAFAAPSGITWETAQGFAITHGGYLATVASAEENAFVFNLVKDPRFWVNDPAGSSIGPWLGGYIVANVRTPSNTTWLWVKNEGAFTYANWAQSQPDATAGKQARLCFWAPWLNQPQSTWGSRPASLSNHGFVVEYDTAPTPPSPPTTPTPGPATVSSGATPVAAPAITLAEGDPAPPLAPGAWIKGSPVKQFDKGKIYVVEFWATWCGPCKISIPHLTELQKKYPDVTFIGQDVSEPDQSAVAPFVAQMGDQMDYRVAVDDVSQSPEGKMNTTWMEAAGQNGIPTAFLVDKDGRIAWIGHPMELEPYLQKLLAGTLDTKQIAADRKAEREFEEKTDGLMQGRQWAAAIQATKDFAAAHPGMLNLPVTLGRLFLFVAAEDPAATEKLVPDIYDSLKDNADALNETAWQLAGDSRLPSHNYPLALKFATRAVALSQGQDPSSLDTLAHIYSLQGDTAKAIQFETQALDKAPNADIKAQISETLKEFQLAAQAAAQTPVK